MRAVLNNRVVVPVNAEARIGYALSHVAPGALRALARLGAIEAADAAVLVAAERRIECQGPIAI